MTEKTDFDLQHFMPYLLNRAAEASSLDFQRYYKARYGMQRTEWRVVFHLGRYGDLTAKEICTRASMHKTKVSRAVAALERRRFLTRHPYQDDRRHELLSLTRAGKVAFDDLVEEAQRFDDALMGAFNVAERDILRRCLRHIIDTGQGG